jgi:hypothetical protein
MADAAPATIIGVKNMDATTPALLLQNKLQAPAHRNPCCDTTTHAACCRRMHAVAAAASTAATAAELQSHRLKSTTHVFWVHHAACKSQHDASHKPPARTHSFRTSGNRAMKRNQPANNMLLEHLEKDTAACV